MEEENVISPEVHAIEKQYARDVRILEARPLLRRLGVLTIIGLEVLSIVFLAIVVFGYVIHGAFVDLRTMGAMFAVNRDEFHAIATTYDAKALRVGAAKVVQGTPTSYDFYAKITNENTDWFATFTFTFSGSGVAPAPQEGFVMPGEDVYVLALGVDAESRPAAPTVAIENIVWHRVDRHVAPNVQDWLDQRNAFTISEPTYTQDIDFGATALGRTTFTITNTTPYAYWLPQFTVVLERAGAIVGISRATVAELDSGEARDVDVRWYGDVPVLGAVTVTPFINYFDADVYMPPRGMPGEDIRDSVGL